MFTLLAVTQPAGVSSQQSHASLDVTMNEFRDLTEVLTANPSEYPLLGRLKDYYQDARWESLEVEPLSREIARIAGDPASGQQLRDFLFRAAQLIGEASKAGGIVIGAAD